MINYLFDASAVVRFYTTQDQRERRVLNYIIDQRRTHRKATLLIPNMCIAEVFNTFAKKYFAEDSPDEAKYKKSLKVFREDVRWGSLFYQYELNRYHVLAADEIIPIEHRVEKRKEWDHLSTLDILIVAMACELTYVMGEEGVRLVTCDHRMKVVCDELGRIEAKERAKSRGDREIGQPSERRWIAPRCIYPSEVSKRDLPEVSGQPPINF